MSPFITGQTSMLTRVRAGHGAEHVESVGALLDSVLGTKNLNAGSGVLDSGRRLRHLHDMGAEASTSWGCRGSALTTLWKGQT